MADKVFMTALSPTMEEGTIIEWKVKEGDKVSSGDVLCEVETDKASMELLSDSSGVLLKILKGNGLGAKVGDVIAAVGKAGEDISSLIAESQSTQTPVASEPPKPASSAAMEIPNPAPIVEEPPKPAVIASSNEIDSKIDITNDSSRLKASPLARRLATLRGIDLNYVKGTGPGGRIVKADLDNEKVPLSSVAKGIIGKTSLSALSGSRLNNEKIALSGKRKVIAQRLTESKNQSPHFYLMTSIKMDNLISSREALNKSRKEGKIGLNAFIMKIIAQVITRHQVINSSWMGDSIQNHSQVDIGLAVAQPDGLITPIVKACEQKGITDIDAELADLIARARNNKLKPEEYTGATFTISSLGSMGIEQFTSIINPPGVAILAIGSIKREPVVNEKDQIEIKSIMRVSLSCDHRVVDGAVGAKFLKDLRETLENPIMALY